MQRSSILAQHFLSTCRSFSFTGGLRSTSHMVHTSRRAHNTKSMVQPHGTIKSPSHGLTCKFCRTFLFLEANEVTFARNSAFEGASFKLDYLTKPSFFEDFGFVEKVKMKDRVKPEDELFLVSYPYFNVKALQRSYHEHTTRKLIIFNGELDRIRFGYSTSPISNQELSLTLGFHIHCRSAKPTLPTAITAP
ncbi:hypothetical protein UlMin_006226 [Ulmus minor]